MSRPDADDHGTIREEPESISPTDERTFEPILGTSEQASEGTVRRNRPSGPSMQSYGQ